MLEFIYAPCNYVYTVLGHSEDTVHEECVKDLAAQQEYLGPLEVILYYNDESFDQEYYGNKSIKRTSKITGA